MRMNRSATRTAAKIIADDSAERLTEIFRIYGELSQGKRIAAAIVKARAVEPITTVKRFIDVISPCIDPRKEKKELAQVFQALRIVVNDEMAALREMLEGALKVLRPGGRLAVITYHSLEDRIVKNFFRTGNFEGREDKDFFGRLNAPLKPLSSKPTVPSDAEVEANPRSRSAKLRVAVKL